MNAPEVTPENTVIDVDLIITDIQPMPGGAQMITLSDPNYPAHYISVIMPDMGNAGMFVEGRLYHFELCAATYPKSGI